MNQLYCAAVCFLGMMLLLLLREFFQHGQVPSAAWLILFSLCAALFFLLRWGLKQLFQPPPPGALVMSCPPIGRNWSTGVQCDRSSDLCFDLVQPAGDRAGWREWAGQ